MFWDLKQRIFLTIDWTAYDKDNRTHGMSQYCCIMQGNFKTCDKIYSWNRDCLVLTYGELRTKVTGISCLCIHHSLTVLILRHLGSIVSDVLSWMSASPPLLVYWCCCWCTLFAQGCCNFPAYLQTVGAGVWSANWS